jgi:hypothetical protein
MFLTIFLLVVVIVLGAVIYLLITDRTINYSRILLLVAGVIIGAVVFPTFFKLLWPTILSSNWILLGAPPEGNAIRVALGDAINRGAEYVKTDLGKIYRLRRDYNDPRNVKWVETKEMSSSQFYEVDQADLDQCKPVPRPLARFVDVKFACYSRDFGTYFQALAVDDTGKVYSLTRNFPFFWDPYLIWFAASSCLGGIVGFLLTYLLSRRHFTSDPSNLRIFKKVE